MSGGDKPSTNPRSRYGEALGGLPDAPPGVRAHIGENQGPARPGLLGGSGWRYSLPKSTYLLEEIWLPRLGMSRANPAESRTRNHEPSPLLFDGSKLRLRNDGNPSPLGGRRPVVVGGPEAFPEVPSWALGGALGSFAFASAPQKRGERGMLEIEVQLSRVGGNAPRVHYAERTCSHAAV
jgi:hypothetical protein